MKAPAALNALFGLYGLAWRAARPFLRRHKRMADGFAQRLVPPDWAAPADIWIQAASGGEAYLARQLLGELALLPTPLRVLCTSCTRQGLDTLEAARQWAADHAPQLTIRVAVFPLDEPALMRRALAMAAPKLLALLETELWPGLLAACAEADVPVALVNGRMTEKSLAGYRRLAPLWRFAAPRRVLAVSDADATRFAALFGSERVGLMPNMKFDGVHAQSPPAGDGNPFPGILPPGLHVLLLASVRKEEEELLLPAIASLREKAPQSAIVVAPRHMERVDAWLEKIKGALPLWNPRQGARPLEPIYGGVQGTQSPGGSRAEPWSPETSPGGSVLLRSSDQPAGPGSIVIWDRFGELRRLYERADAVFVGGSLAPLGGQNFLEAAALGRAPVVGPHLKNFAWTGEDFFTLGLARRVPDAMAMAEALLQPPANPRSREAIAAETAAYLAPRRGGSRMAAELICGMLER